MLLSSIEGAAITNVRIKGVQHEFTAMPGVWEDVTHILLNLKEVPFKLHTSQPQIVTISHKGEGVVTSGSIRTQPERGSRRTPTSTSPPWARTGNWRWRSR